MEQTPIDDRSATAKALSWVSRIMTVSLSTVIPALIGYYADQRWQTVPIFALAGFAFGLMAGGYLLWKLIRSLEAASAKETSELSSGSRKWVEVTEDGEVDAADESE